MKIANIKKKLEQVKASDIKIVTDEARWGGWNVKMTARIAGYYDFELHKQIHKTLDVRTPDDALAVFLASDTDSYETKPYHDESDLMSDYCAWSFHERINEIDWCVRSAKEMVRV